MKPIRTVIIEDEQPASDLLVNYLKDFPEIEILEICNDGFSGLKAIQQHKPSLVFLDIQMPKLTGFELLEVLDEKPSIIFTTAYDEFAIRAFELNAVDYLLKPFSKERFANALLKAEERISSDKFNETPALQKLTEMPQQEDRFLERIVIKKNTKIIVVPVNKISHIEAYDDYVIIHSEGEKHLKQKSMGYYESNLSPKMFIRIHRSYIVNVDCIEQILLWEKDTYKVKLKNGIELRASRAGYKRLKDIF